MKRVDQTEAVREARTWRPSLPVCLCPKSKERSLKFVKLWGRKDVSMVVTLLYMRNKTRNPKRKVLPKPKENCVPE